MSKPTDGASNVSDNSIVDPTEIGLKDKIIKYFKIDDLIKKKCDELKEEIKLLKANKKELESHIIKALDKIDEDVINFEGHGALVKKKTTTRGILKVATMKTTLVDYIKKKHIFPTEDETQAFIDELFTLFENTRVSRTKTVLQRKYQKNNK